MSLRFRKRVKIAPGLDINIGKKSLSARVGGRGFGFTAGTSGKTVSGGLPGTGLGYTKRIKSTPPIKAETAKNHNRRPLVVGLVLAILLAGWAVTRAVIG